MYWIMSRIDVTAPFRRRDVDDARQIFQDQDFSSSTLVSGNPRNFFIMDNWILIILKECKASSVASFTTLLNRFTALLSHLTTLASDLWPPIRNKPIGRPTGSGNSPTFLSDGFPQGRYLPESAAI